MLTLEEYIWILQKYSPLFWQRQPLFQRRTTKLQLFQYFVHSFLPEQI